MPKNLAFTPLAIALAAGCALGGQDTSTAVLAGRVMGQGGQPLQGVRVLIESPALLGAREAVTDSSGQFRVRLLPNGEYAITYILSGYITRKLTTRLVAGQTGNGSASLAPVGTATAEVEIVGRAAQVDKTDTVVQYGFDTDYLEKITGRGLDSVGQLAPGLNTSALSTQGRLNIRGGTGRSAKLLIDGATNTEMWGGYVISTFNVADLVESVSVMLSPVNARYGNTDGGIISMVTSRGSNTWAGTVRVGVYRSYWWAMDAGYGYRNTNQIGGQAPDRPMIDTNDVLGKNYTVTLQGPLWKDRITFAYGAQLSPTSYDTPLVANALGRVWPDVLLPQTEVGTFFQQRDPGLPGYGDVIRKPEMYLYNAPDGAFNQVGSSTYNQFTVYAQITPSHSLEYNYVQSDSESTDSLGIAEGGAGWNKSGFSTQSWNIAYKGIIGSSGVLEARYGKNLQRWWYGDPSAPHFPIRTWTLASRVPLRGYDLLDFDQPGGAIGSTGDPGRYLINGLLGFMPLSNTNSSLLYNDDWDGSFLPGPADGYRRNMLGNGANVDTWDGGGTTAAVLNYQHILSTGMGSHIIDAGMQRDHFNWVKKAGGALRFFNSPGRIAIDLSAADIYNPSGSSAPASQYAGKFIVWNVATARLSDVDPWTVNRWNLRDGPAWLDTDSLNPRISRAMAPNVYIRFGTGGGDFWANMDSYYINDLWSINDNHSVQAGMRFDKFYVEDTGTDLMSYGQPTFRFEYKWDISGDQRRLLNISIAQYHSMQPAGLFSPMVASPGTNQQYRYWSNGSPQPHLVGIEEFLDIEENYRLEAPVTYGGSNMYRVADDWKAPISTECAVGLRRALDNGGYWKTTLVYKTFANNAFDYYPGEEIEMEGQKNVTRVLRNSSGYERLYYGVELEWDLPFGKRINFGGSYTYSRLMDNTPRIVDYSGANDVDATPLNLDWWWDEVLGGRSAWSPVRPMNYDHLVKWYLLFDLSSGKFSSSLAFSGQYGSRDYASDGYVYGLGVPMGTYSGVNYSNFFDGTAGGQHEGTGSLGIVPNVYVPFNAYSTAGDDEWDCNLRYLITVPLVKKIAWMATITMANPFNHRNRVSPLGNGPAATNTIYPLELTGSLYKGAEDPYRGVWRNDRNVNGYYMGRWPGRSIGIETGIRF